MINTFLKNYTVLFFHLNLVKNHTEGVYMIGLIVCGHGLFGDGLYSSIKLIAGEQENFQIVNFEEDSNTKTLNASLQKALNKVEKGKGTVIFTDIPGGTPYNQAVLISTTMPNIKVVSGVNLPCLLTACFSRQDSIEVFLSKVIDSGRSSLSVFEKQIVKTEDKNGERRGI